MGDSKNCKGEYSVRYILTYPGRPPNLYPENLYFKNKVFGNEIQCETAIKEWETDQELSKKTHVKYL